MKPKLVKMRVASLDPGTVNMAANVMDVRGHKTKIIHSAMIENTISDLKDENRPGLERKFIKEIKTILDFEPDVIVIERFQNRGRGMGALVEKVSYMLGIIVMLARRRKIKVCFVVASQWKNKIARDTKQKMQTYYKLAKPVVPHLVDAYLIGEYHAGISFNIKSLTKIKKFSEKRYDS